MRPGTPGFIGARLLEAREARCMPLITLADLAGVSRQTISNYEKGKASPGPDILQRIGEQLQVPVSYFTKPLPTAASTPTFFRSMAAATKAIRLRAKRLLGWQREIAMAADAMVELPEVNLPHFTVAAEPARITFPEIERFAQETRRHWSMGDGPIGNLVWLMENNGILVGRAEIDDEKLDGLSQWFEERPAILLNADKHCAYRSRLDGAHELGHLIVHRAIDASRLDKKADFKLIEKQAFAFGGAFLLPARVFGPLAYSASLDGFLTLKEKWKVSVKAMIMRAGNLRVISEEQKRRLFVSYSRRGWNANEPLDDQLPVERPRLLDRVLDVLTHDGGVSRDTFLASLCLPAPDVERLAGLPRGYFDGKEPTVTEFVPRIRPAMEHADEDLPGEIIQFPAGRQRERN